MTSRWAQPVLKPVSGKATPLTRLPVGTLPFDEGAIRDLVASTPSILPTAYFDTLFERPVCLGTEFPVPSVGRIDALFLSPSGHLTIVETKLWCNPEARRQVVAQIVDYARALSAWTYEELERNFNSRRANAGLPPQSLFRHVCDVEDDACEELVFVDAVSRALRLGRFLLLLVGDGIRESTAESTDFFQQTPTLQFTFGLVELGCFESPLPTGGYLFVPHVVARTNEITRAIVQIDVKDTAAATLDLSVTVPQTKDRKPPTDAISESEFYDVLTQATSSSVSVKVRQFVNGLLEANDALQQDFSPKKMLLRLETPEPHATSLVVLALTPDGKLWTNKPWIDYLAANFPSEVLQILDRLEAVDKRLRPRITPDGIVSVPKGGNAADVKLVADKLPDLMLALSDAIREASAGPRMQARRSELIETDDGTES